MRLMSLLTLTAVVAMLCPLAGAQQIGQPADDAALQAQYQTAHTDAVLANARLGLVRVQMHLQKGDVTQAKIEMARVQGALEALGPNTDTSAYQQMIARLQKQIEQADATAQRQAANQPQAAETVNPEVAVQGYGDPAVVDKDQPGLQGQVDMAVEQGNMAARVNVPGSRTAMDTDPVVVRQRTLDRQTTWDQGRYAPAQELVDTGKLLELDRERVHYQYALTQARDGARRDELLHVVEATVPPPAVMNYPANWQQISERRKEYADGVLWKSRTFKDSDGKEKYVAAYDVSDLLFVPIFPGPSEYNIRRPTNPLTFWTNKFWYPDLYLYGPYSGNYGPGGYAWGGRGGYGGGARGNWDIIPPYYYPFEADPIYQHRLAQRRAWLLQQVNALLSTVQD